MKKRILIPGLLIGGLMLGSMALANPYGIGIGNHHGGDQHTINHDMVDDEQQQLNVESRIAQMDAFLDLDEFQKAQIVELLNTYWQVDQTVIGEHDSRHGLMHSAEPDPATLRKVMVKRAELRADQIVKQQKLQKDMSAIFTEEQREKADLVWNSRGHHGNGMHSSGHGI